MVEPVPPTRMLGLSSGARRFVEGIGRTEDLAFSPSGRRLAVAAYSHRSIGVLELTTAVDRSGWWISGTAELHSSALHSPHGIAFVDDDVLVVANRTGAVTFLRLVETGVRDPRLELLPLRVRGNGLRSVRTPGSVAVAALPDGTFELFTADNRRGQVTRHRCSISHDAVEILEGGVLLRGLLDVPDGIALDDDWLAVSDHGHHVVLVYGRRPPESGVPRPLAMLRGARYPHGLGFDANARRLFVADAGSPFVHVYERPGHSWSGLLYPTRSLRVVTDDAFDSVPSLDEGGPKGLTVDPSGRFLAVTSDTIPLGLIEVSAIDATLGTAAFDEEMGYAYELASMDCTNRRMQRLAAAADRRWYRRARRAAAWARHRIRS